MADAGKRSWDELTTEYGAMLMEGLAVMGCKRSGRGQACERAPTPDGLPEESPVERGQRLPKVGLPAVGWSSWASSRTTVRGFLLGAKRHHGVTAEAAATSGGAASAKARATGTRP